MNNYVLIFSTSYFPLVGGAEVAIKEITSRLPEHSFHLITSRHLADLPRDEMIGSVHVHRIGRKLFLPIFGFIAARRLQKKYGKPNVVFASQASHAGGGAWLYARFSGVPLVVNVQEGKDLERQSIMIRFFRRLIIRGARKVTVISSYLKRVVRSMGVPEDKISVIPNGVDMKDFVRKPCEFHDEHIILSTSRLVPKNGMDILVQAGVELKKLLPATKWRMMIVGDGPQRQELESMIASCDFAEQVSLVGAKPHAMMKEYLAQADVFVRPSRSEGLGVSFLEAMAAGVPIVAPLVGGIEDFLEDGVTGFVCEPENPASVAEKIAFVLQNKSVAADAVARARSLVAEKYNWDHIARRYDELFSQL